MAEFRTSLLNFLLRILYKRRLAACQTALDVRRVSDSSPGIVPKGARFIDATVGGVTGEWVEVSGASSLGTLLYLHGGGYVCMSPRSYRAITAGFALRGFRVFAPDYRLAPEHPFPAAIEDASAVWEGLRGNVGGPLFVAGDSAGGGLALALLLTLREQGRDPPDAACLFSPWTDLAGTGQSVATNRDRDPLLVSDKLQVPALAYAGGEDLRAPLLSPLYADFAGLPRMIAFVGDTEILLDDSKRVAEKARSANVQFELRTYRDMPHVWPLFNVVLPAGRRALDEAAAFLLTGSSKTPAAQ
jgi:epsilon-lactone hydrolase